MVCNITHTVGGKLYTFDRNGALREKAGWIDLYEYGEQDEKTSFWVYCDANGIATVGWKKISGIWYHFDEDGYMTADDWAKDSVGWMYMDKNGRITKSKWVKSGGKWYYLKSNGYMACSQTLTIEGKTYRFGSDGAML